MSCRMLENDDTYPRRRAGRFSRAGVVLSTVACANLLACVPAQADSGEQQATGGVVPLATTRVASGLIFPVFATHAPDDFSRLFILEKRGVIRILNLDTGVLNATPFLNIDSIVLGGTDLQDERGLLGLAFHPKYAENGFFYVNYTGNSGSGDTFVRRYTVSANPDIADSASGTTVMSFNQPQGNHNGGWIGFGPVDKLLYIATGDGGNFCDTGTGHTSTTGNAQDITNNLLGKMLRIDVDGGSPFAIPPGNPFVGVTGDDEIWAYGLRNPWRPSFDRETGDLYIADVGQGVWEEVNYQSAASNGGENYGWRCMEGNHCSSVSGCSTTGCTCFSNALTDPIFEYSHSQGCSVSGGYVYRGCAIPSLQGTYFLADFGCNGPSPIWSFKVVGGSMMDLTVRTAELNPSIEGLTVNQISSFGEDALGEIYIVDQGSGNSGQVFKIVPETFAGPDCNDNDVHDACDIAAGTSPDEDENGVPDGCTCPPDLNGDGEVRVPDLIEMLAAWGPCPEPCPPSCPADLDGNCEVRVPDLIVLLGAWGLCP